ncbi:MAG: folylpolyglutamate synthase/dihydrofolate synthase family protein [Sphingomicrobium sp.]
MADFATSAHPAVQAQLDRLALLSPAGDRLGLGRIAVLLDRLGRPQDALPPVFHVAGTNGKGSTCAFLRAALEASGRTVHMFTSPHLVRFNERIRIAGRLIQDQPLAALLEQVIDADHGLESSFFEVTAAAALLAFARTPADAAVIEVGLGGRLDATNVIASPAACGIAAIGLDHQDFLGRRLVDIAGEKAGIAKAGVPLVTQRYPPVIAARVGEVAGQAGAHWLPRGDAWDARVARDRIAYRDSAGTLDLPLPGLPGRHQSLNAALAVAMLRHQQALPISDEALAEGIRSARWPGRLQLLGEGPLTALLPGRRMWVDGGHNRSAAKAIAAAMTPRAPFDAIFALTRNRPIADVLGPVARLIRKAHTVPLAGHPHHDPRDIAMFAQNRLGPRECYPAFSLDQAVERLASDDDGAADVLIFGSLYLAGQALAANGEAPD